MSYSSQWRGAERGQWRGPDHDRRAVVSPAAVPDAARHVPAHTAELFRKGVAAHNSFLTNKLLPDLHRAVDLLRLALESAERAGGEGAPDDPYWGRCLNSLAVALFDRHRFTCRTGATGTTGASSTTSGADGGGGDDPTGDLVAALRYLLAAYGKAETGTVHYARVLFNLFTALNAHLALAGPPLPPDLRERLPSVQKLREEMGNEPGVAVIERLRSAHESGYSAVAASGPAAGYPQLARAVRLLPRAVWGAREQVLDFLAEHHGLATDAAACAIAADCPDDAVRLLDHGRAVMWEQQLRTRTWQQELKQSESQEANRLARRLNRVYAGLSELDPLATQEYSSTRLREGATSPGNDVRMDTDRWGGTWTRYGLGTEMGSWSMHRLETEWGRLAEKARTVLPNAPLALQEYADLRRAAEGGPVVYVVVSPWGCDALLVTVGDDRPARIPLHRLTAADAEQRAQRYLAAMTGAHGDREEVIRDTLDWLWYAVVGPVLEALPANRTGPKRTWWVPTGPLTTLPLHAAASKVASESRSALDQTISSYTATMSALVRARDAHKEAADQGRERDRGHLLVAADSSHLPGAGRFHAHLRHLVSWWHRTALMDTDATHAKVSKALPQHAWTHFDCHAVQDLNEPLKSHLVLHDKPLTVSDLADLPFAHAEFAVLAACTTAAGGESVRDEWVSLTAALMYSEFQSVIGTLWPVPDGPSARITQSLYTALIRVPRRWPLPGFARRTLSHANSADALRLAVLAERANRPDHPSAWVSFVHYGI